MYVRTKIARFLQSVLKSSADATKAIGQTLTYSSPLLLSLKYAVPFCCRNDNLGKIVIKKKQLKDERKY